MVHEAKKAKKKNVLLPVERDCRSSKTHIRSIIPVARGNYWWLE